MVRVSTRYYEYMQQPHRRDVSLSVPTASTVGILYYSRNVKARKKCKLILRRGRTRQ